MKAPHLPTSLRLFLISRARYRGTSTALMTPKSLLKSCVEVERKFLPTSYLHEVLQKAEQDSAHAEGCLVRDKIQDPSILPTRLFLLSKKAIRDTYYDLDGQLETRGIWIRYRTSRTVENTSLSTLSSNTESSELEAKVRLSGDYTDSQFLELQEKAAIQKLIEECIPDATLESLDITADFETFRQTYGVCEVSSDTTNAEPEIRVDLDEVTSSKSSFHKRADFKHFIGELEMTKEVLGGADEGEHKELRLKAAASMQKRLDQFMMRHCKLFPSSPRPKGKLEVFFDWKGR